MLLKINDPNFHKNRKFYFIQVSVELFFFNNIFDMALVIYRYICLCMSQYIHLYSLKFTLVKKFNFN